MRHAGAQQCWHALRANRQYWAEESKRPTIRIADASALDGLRDFAARPAPCVAVFDAHFSQTCNYWSRLACRPFLRWDV